MKRKRTPPHGAMTIERKVGSKHAGKAYDAHGFRVAKYTPSTEDSSDELHFVIQNKLLDYPVVLRFRDADTLGFLIEELISYKQEIWPDSPMPFPLDADVLEQVVEDISPDLPAEGELKTVTDAPTV